MRVMVIHSNQEYSGTDIDFPPIGATGDIVEGLDDYNDYEVVFDGYPGPTPRDEAWTVHESMIVFIDNKKEKSKEKAIAKSITMA